MTTFKEQKLNAFDEEFCYQDSDGKMKLLDMNFSADNFRFFIYFILDDYEAKVREVIGEVDQEFLSQPDAEDYVGEWAINKDRQRILSALNL